MAAYLFMWGLFTAVMFIGTFRLSRALQVVFGTLTLLFFLLAYGDYASPGPAYARMVGWEGVLCGFTAIYTGLAHVMNAVAGRTVWPLGRIQPKTGI